jgi:acyl carrier protein
MKSKEAILEELNKVFHSVFKNESFIVKSETTADDIKGWNSLSHMHLIDAVEQHFNCEFSFNEVMKFTNVGDMIAAISNKIS